MVFCFPSEPSIPEGPEYEQISTLYQCMGRSFSLEFFCRLLIFSDQLFQKILSGISSERQTVLAPDLGLICVQTVCKGYQQTSLVVGKEFRVLTFLNFRSFLPCVRVHGPRLDGDSGVGNGILSGDSHRIVHEAVTRRLELLS